MHAKIDLIKPTFEKRYEAKDVEEIKNLICKECKNKIFAYVGEGDKYKDCKGRRVIKYTGENPVACLWDEAKIKK